MTDDQTMTCCDGSLPTHELNYSPRSICRIARCGFPCRKTPSASLALNLDKEGVPPSVVSSLLRSCLGKVSL